MKKNGPTRSLYKTHRGNSSSPVTDPSPAEVRGRFGAARATDQPDAILRDLESRLTTKILKQRSLEETSLTESSVVAVHQSSSRGLQEP